MSTVSAGEKIDNINCMVTISKLPRFITIPVQRAPFIGITKCYHSDNIISFSKCSFHKLVSINGKGNLDYVIFWLLQSEIPWPKTIPLSGAFFD